ncbi:MAG: hypothetical protein Ct9H90mP23_0540 [Methanobacteriota archaeon]|nr:MAG: hypothetical protein Ct9H90mP23_0540 [Euryarchaeota archaeon]
MRITNDSNRSGCCGYISSIIGVFSIAGMKNMHPGAALRNTTFIGAALFIGEDTSL